jgi:hypothetical protein
MLCAFQGFAALHSGKKARQDVKVIPAHLLNLHLPESMRVSHIHARNPYCELSLNPFVVSQELIRDLIVRLQQYSGMYNTPTFVLFNNLAFLISKVGGN